MKPDAFDEALEYSSELDKWIDELMLAKEVEASEQLRNHLNSDNYAQVMGILAEANMQFDERKEARKLASQVHNRG